MNIMFNTSRMPLRSHPCATRVRKHTHTHTHTQKKKDRESRAREGASERDGSRGETIETGAEVNERDESERERREQW